MLDAVDPLDQLLHQDAQLQPGQPHAQTGMRPALPERQVAVHAPAQVDGERPVKGPLVAVARDEPEQHLVARLDLFAVVFKVLGRGATKVRGGRGPADELVGHAFPSGFALHRLELLHQAGLVGQRVQSGCNRIACGVVARSHQQAKEVAELGVADHVALRVGLSDQVQNATGVSCAALALHQLGRVVEQVGPGGRAKRHEAVGLGVHLVDHMAGEIAVGVGHERVALVHQPIQVFFGQPRDAPEHAHRQLAGNVVRGVKLAQRQGLVKDAHTQLANLLFVQRHHGLGKGLGHQHAGAGVLGRVGLLKGPPRHVLFMRLVFHTDALGRRQALVVAVEFQNIGMPRDRPKALAIGPVAPGHRVFVAQALEGVVRRAVHIAVVVRQIGMSIVGGVPNRHCALSKQPSKNCAIHCPNSGTSAALFRLAWARAMVSASSLSAKKPSKAFMNTRGISG